MKRITLITAAALTALAFAGCGGSTLSGQTATQQITQVWHTAENAMAHGDYAGVKATMTPQAAAVVDAFGGATLDVCAGADAVAQPTDGDEVKGSVVLAVTAIVEAVTGCLARGGG